MESDTPSDTTKSSKQFVYCSFCRLNHKKGRKHVYSKRHQEIMGNILDKFRTKVSEAKSSLDRPVVEGVSCERGAKFWCYFCASDIDKHVHTDTHTLKFAGFITHLNSTEHGEETNKFLHSNLLDKTKAAQFIITEDDMNRFAENADKAIHEYKKRMTNQRLQEMEKIRRTERARNLTCNTKDTRSWREPDKAKQKSDQKTTTYGRADGGNTTTYGRADGGNICRRKAIFVRGEGVTSILQTNTGGDVDKEGNIFSGAIPPWMRSDPDTKTIQKTEIGPTMEDFQKHLEREKKGKLPADRVGAQFDHTASTSAQWLPSFGRVWSKGRRLQSKNFFEKQHGFAKSTKASSSMASGTWKDSKGSRSTNSAHMQNKNAFASTADGRQSTQGTGLSMPPTIKAYQRKRPATSTITSMSSWDQSQSREQNSSESGHHSNISVNSNNVFPSNPTPIIPYQKKRMMQTTTMSASSKQWEPVRTERKYQNMNFM